MLRSIAISLIVLFGLSAQAQTKIDPTVQIYWPYATGSTAPLPANCNSASYGEPYLNIATSPNTYYVCGVGGWVQPAGPTGPPGPPSVFLGPWSSVVTYTIGQSVSYVSGGATSTYTSLVNGNLNNIPASSPTDWGLVASGAVGGSGATVINVLLNGASGAGNSATCQWNLGSFQPAVPVYTGCHDDYAALNTILSNTANQFNTIFFPKTTPTLGYCDYYSSHQLVGTRYLSLIGEQAVTFYGNTSICFPTGISGIQSGGNSSFTGLAIYGGDPWIATSLSTYVVPARYGGTGINADGLQPGGDDNVDHVIVGNFAGDCINADSTIVPSADNVIMNHVFTQGCRGNGIVHHGADSQVGVITSLFSRYNQIYNVLENNSNSTFGNVYNGGNTSNGHYAFGLSTGSYTALAGTVSNLACVINTDATSVITAVGQNVYQCTVTMSTTNTLYANSRPFNAYDFSGNDMILLTGTGTTADGNPFLIIAKTANSFTFYWGTNITSTTGTASYNPGQRVWSSQSSPVFGGGWGVQQGSSVFNNPYSESNDEANDFRGITSQDSVVIAPGAGIYAWDGGIQTGAAPGLYGISNFSSNSVLQVANFLYPQLVGYYGGYKIPGSPEPTMFLGSNYDFARDTLYSQIQMSRSNHGNTSAWWYIGQPGSNNTSMSAGSVAFPDALTTTGRSSINNTTWPAWFPAGEFRGNSLGTGNPDCFYGSGAAAPTSGSWQVCDFIYNTGVTSTGTLGWVNTTAGTPGTWTAISVTGGGTGPGTSGEVGVYNSSGIVIGDTLLGHASNTLVNTDTNGIQTQSIAAVGTGFNPAFDVTFPNSSSGTTALFLAKINSSGQAIKTLTTDTGAALVYPVDSTHSNPACAAGTTGNACLVFFGIATVTFDSSGASHGDCVGVSSSTAGAAHDIGATVSGVTSIGQVVSSSVAANSTGLITVGPCIITSGGTSPSVAVGTVTAISPLATPTVVNGGSSTAAILNFGIPANTLVSAPAPFRFFGDGNEGALLVSTGTTTLVGEHWYSSISISSGATLTSNSALPLVLRSTGTCTIAGTISGSINSGAPGLATTAGVGGGGGGGGGGGTAAGVVGSGNTLSQAGSVFTGEAGGAAGAASGGNGGNATSMNRSALNLILSGSVQWSSGLVTAPNTIGGNAGGNGGTGAAAAGRGGQGIFIICPTISFTGTVDASGQNGTNSAANNQGAGGGGGGGVIAMAAGTYSTNTGTMSVALGTGGGCLAFTGCGTGGNGAAGTAVQFTIQ